MKKNESIKFALRLIQIVTIKGSFELVFKTCHLLSLKQDSSQTAAVGSLTYLSPPSSHLPEICVTMTTSCNMTI